MEPKKTFPEFDVIDNAIGIPKVDFHSEIKKALTGLGFAIVTDDYKEPWGVSFKLSKDQTDLFINYFFANSEAVDQIRNQYLTLKILLIAPQKKISWQYHRHRTEIWKIVRGPVGVILSNSDVCPPNHTTKLTGETVYITNATRHRAIGLNSWAIIAELWVHSSRTLLSTEDDIVRLEDDFGRVL